MVCAFQGFRAFEVRFFVPAHIFSILLCVSSGLPSSVFDMSRRFKRVAHTHKAILACLSQNSGLKPVEEVPAQRRPYGSRDADLVMGRQGLVYGPDGVFSHAGPAAPLQLGREMMVMVRESGKIMIQDEERVAKNQCLWNRWETDVTPGLIQPLLELLSKTCSMRDVAIVRQDSGCVGCENGRLLGIFCVFFDRESSFSDMDCNY